MSTPLLYTNEEELDEETSDTETILGTLASTKSQQTQGISHALNSHPDKIYAKVKMNEHSNLSLKVDTEADTLIITITDL